MAINNISSAARSAMCDALVDLVDGGSGQGKIKIYTGSFAAQLAELLFTDPAFGAASNGVATADTISDEDSALDTGTAAVCRITNSDDTVIWEGTVGTSGADINLNTTSITTGDRISISSFTVTMPAS